MATSKGKDQSKIITADKWKSSIEAYKKSIQNAISTQTPFDPQKCNDEHWKIYATITNGYKYEDKLDLREYLCELRFNIVEQEEERTFQNSGETLPEGHLFIYLSREWVYIVGHTNKMGNVNITFGNEKPGFSARISHHNGKLAWSEDYDMMAVDKQGTALKVHYLIDHIVRASGARADVSSREMISELFVRVKETVETKLQEVVSQIILVTPTEYFLSYRTALRECCKKAGFKRITFLSESALASYRIFQTLSLVGINVQDISVVVVKIGQNDVKLYLFGCDATDDKTNVYMQSTSYCSPISKENIRGAYKRALMHLPGERNYSIGYYVVFSEPNNPANEKMVDDIFREDKLIKTKNLLSDQINDVLFHFATSPAKLGNFLDSIASDPNVKADAEVTTDQESEEEISNTNAEPMKNMFDVLRKLVTAPDKTNATLQNTSRESTIATRLSARPSLSPGKPQQTSGNDVPSAGTSKPVIGSAKLPLKINTLDGRTYKILALTNWTLKRLKDEFLSCYSKKDSGVLTLHYNSKPLANDENLLSSYKLDADSIIEATFTSRNDASALVKDIAKKVAEPILVIGNCLALKNGTEPVHVGEIKKGSVVLARIDFENLTIGEVGLTCKIKGFDETVYVGVKFRKQLALGSSCIQIIHDDVIQGHCDKCKGRRSLFIPLDYVGGSKDHIFQLQ